MAFDTLVRNLVGLANTLTSSLQSTVQHSAWIGQDQYDAPQFATAVPRPAIVQTGPRRGKSPTGDDVITSATVYFLGPVEPNGAAGRKEPIDPRDRIVLQDGYTAPLVAIGPGDLIDPATGHPYLYSVGMA